MSLGLCLYHTAAAQVVIDINFLDVDGAGGSGYTDAEETRILNLASRWEERLIDYIDDTNSPNAITIDFSAVTIDGTGGTLGQANVSTSVQTGNFTVVETGFAQFDIDDIANLSDDEFDRVVEHEMGHVLGLGVLWTNNNVYVNGSGQYTGEAALAAYQRDVDPDATFIPVFANNNAPGSDDAHWDEGTVVELFITNQEASYFGETLDDELMTPFLTGSGYVSDYTLGSFQDTGYIVNYEIGRELFWDGVNTVANGTIDSGTGVWSATSGTTNFTIENGDINSAFISRSAVHFEGTGSVITIDGTVNPYETIFNDTGFTITGGTYDVTEFNSTITVTNPGDIATLDTTVSGTGSLIIDGAGTLLNTGLIETDLEVSTGASLETGAGTLDSSIELDNDGTVTLTGDSIISNYNSDGGTLQGAGLLTATNYNLSNGAQLLSETGSGTLNAISGDIELAANTAVDTVVISSGATLATNGDILTAAPSVNNSGDLVINGNLTVDDYSGITGGTVQGNGELSVTSFNGGSIGTTASAAGVLNFTVNANGGIVNLGTTSTLFFNVTDTSVLSSLTAFPLINNASAITNGFASFDTTALGSDVAGLFDTNTGILYIISNESTSNGSTPNGINVATSIFGSSLETNSNFANVQLTDGTLDVIALATQRQAQFADVTIDTELQELSPEIYGSVTEYGIQSFRRFLDIPVNKRNALITKDSKIFGGLNGFSIESASSIDDADFTLQGTGGYFGIENSISKFTKWGFMLGAESSDISGDRLSLDGEGVMGSVYVETFLPIPFNDGPKPGALRASLGFANFDLNGTRSAQGLVNTADDINNQVIHAGINYKAQLYTNRNGHVASFVGVNHIQSTTDSFSENGLLNNLAVNEFQKNQTYVEFGMEAVISPDGSPWGIQGSASAIFNIGDDATEIMSSFSGATTPFTVSSPGFSNTSYEANLGIFYNINRRSTVNLSGFTSVGDDLDSALGGSLSFNYIW